MIDVVVKVGGSLLAAAEDLDAVLAAIGELSLSRRVLVVPGGGPFADAVRVADRQVTLSDDAAHWMAVLGMDQYAHLLADRSARLARRTVSTRGLAAPRDSACAPGVVVWTLAEAVAALEARRVPILAPTQWLRETDPLPHSWDVTSDSIAAWVAGQAGARVLVLVKARGATGELVDHYFAAALPPHVTATIVPAEKVAAVFAQIAGAADFETI